jgi:hypothetical protein
LDEFDTDSAHVEASGYDRRHTTANSASLLAKDYEPPKLDLMARRIPGAARLVRRPADPPIAVKATAKKRTARKGCRQQQLAGERSQDDSLH